MRCKGMIFYSPRQIFTHTFLFCKRKSLFRSTLMQKNVAARHTDYADNLYNS